MSFKNVSFIYLVFIILFSTLVFGVGIGQTTRERQILFEPGLEKTYSFMLSDSLRIDASLEGDLAPYAVIDDPVPGGPARSVEVILKLPEFLAPGVHTLYIVASEKPDSNAAVGGVASVRVGMEVFALYPGKRPDFKGVLSKDCNINDATPLGLSIMNLGEEAIDNAYGNISIYGPDGSLITVLGTDSKSIGAYESVSLTSEFDTSLHNLKAGTYKAVGNFTYDGINYPKLMEGYFIVGQMNVNIIDNTKQLFVNSTNKFEMMLQSDWTGDIDNVYAKITLPTGKVIKTPNVDLIKSSQGVKPAALIETHIETDGIPMGQNYFDVVIYFKDKTASSRLPITIIDGTPPPLDKPSLITPMTIFIGISVLIVLFVILYFFVFRREGGRTSSYSSTNTGANQTSNDIRPPSL